MAALIGAVNTVVREGDVLVGPNTDGKGFQSALRDNAGLDPSGKRFVFLGAGGAARAMTVEGAPGGAASVTVVNRTPERGQRFGRVPGGPHATRGPLSSPGREAAPYRRTPMWW